MKQLNSGLYLLLLTLFTNVLLAQTASVTLSVRVASTCHSEYGVRGGNCWETGDEEYTGKVWIFNNTDGSERGGTCRQVNNNGNACNTSITDAYTYTNTAATVIDARIDAWEDDAGNRCDHNSGDDCRTQKFLRDWLTNTNDRYFRGTASASNGTYSSYGNSSDQFGDDDAWARIEYTWKYSGTNNLITPGCSALTSSWSANMVPSWSVNLTSGRTYRFSTCGGSSDNTFIRIYSSDGYTVVASNDNFCGNQSQVDFTPGSTGTYYIEVKNASGIVLPNGGTLTYQDISTPELNGGAISISSVTICVGGNNTLSSTTAASGGFNSSYSYQWQSSSDNINFTDMSGATGTATSTPTMNTPGTYYYRRRVSDCRNTIRYSNTVTQIVLADPNAPIVTKIPNISAVCAGTTLSVSAVYGTEPGALCAMEYSESTDNGVTWSSYSTTLPSISATGSNNRIRVRVSGGCASGCNASNYTEVQWTVSPAISISSHPSEDDYCASSPISPLSCIASGGTGVLNYQWQSSTSSGGAFTNITGATLSTYTPIVPAGGILFYRCVVSSNGCNSTTSNNAEIKRETQVSPGTINTTAITACVGYNPPKISSSSDGSGSSGDIEYRWYLNGTAITSTDVDNDEYDPSAINTPGVYSYTRLAISEDCPDSAFTTAKVITIVADPIAPSATKSPNISSVCIGQTLTLTGVTDNGGGTGTCNIQYRFYNGTSWSSWSTTLPSFTANVGTNTIEIYKECSGSSCNNSSTNSYSWTVVAQPIVIAQPAKNSSICQGNTISLGYKVTGGVSPIQSWEVWNAGSWTSVSGGLPSTGVSYNSITDSVRIINLLPNATANSTFLYRSQITYDANSGCSNKISDTAIVSTSLQPTTANASFDQLICKEGTTVLSANAPTIGSGLWSWSGAGISTGGSVSYLSSTTANNPNAEIKCNLGSGINQSVFTGVWTISNGTCPSSRDSVLILVNNPDSVSSQHTASGTCYIDSNTLGWVNIFDANDNIIASVNGGGLHLGNVTVTQFVQPTAGTFTITSAGSCLGQTMTYMRKMYQITSSQTGWFGNPLVKVRLFFNDNDLQNLITNSVLNTGSCATDDDVIVIADVHATKYNTGDLPGAASGVFLLQNSSGSGFRGLYTEYTVGSFSDFYLHGSFHEQALPVTYLSLDAKANESDINVSWRTAVEINNKGFHVQKSTDGINFHEVTTIEGNGNTTETSFYQYVDKDVRAGQVYYYKLMQEDFDGKINPSKIVSAQLYNSESNWTVSEFIPNPAKTITSLHIESLQPEQVSISVYNGLGKWLFTYDKLLEKGFNKVTLGVENFLPGLYFVKVTSGNHTVGRKLVID